MPLILILTPLLFGLSFLSGMLGLGVAFVAIPVLGLFGYDLINVIQPWALLLNGLTAISAAILFWRRGMVDKRGALILVTITTIGAPLGVWRGREMACGGAKAIPAAKMFRCAGDW